MLKLKQPTKAILSGRSVAGASNKAPAIAH